MVKKLWKIVIFILVVLLNGSFAIAMNFKGLADINYSSTTNFSNGNTTSEKDTLNQNYSFSGNKTITPLISSRFSLRTRFSDTEATDAAGNISSTYNRTLSPAVDISYTNPLFNIGGGYSLRERWNQAGAESRRTSEDYYSRFSLVTYNLPSLSMQVNRRQELGENIDKTATGYSSSSSYVLPSKDIDLTVYGSVQREEVENPLSINNKTVTDGFSTGYSIGRSASLWDGKTTLSVSYRGNYSWSETRQFSTRSGSVRFLRKSIGGLYDLGKDIGNFVDELSSEVSLADENVSIRASANINLNIDRYHNIGIWVSLDKSVDKLYIYVDTDISAETVLSGAGSWKVFSSNLNQPDTWSERSIKSVTVRAFDVSEGIYRYEIELSSAVSASFFRVVNMDTSDVEDTFVTEIEAHGVDEIPDTDVQKTESTFFSQLFNISAGVRLTDDVHFSLHYSIDRSDQEPESVTDSIGGFFADIFDKSTNDEGELNSNIQKSYGMSASWMAYRNLSTSIGVQRNETYDNKGTSDISNNSYSASLNTNPLPTLGVNITFIRSERFSFEEKTSSSDSALLNVASKLYRFANLVTDISYSNSRSFTTDTQSSSRSVSSQLDVTFTKKLAGNLQYSFNSSESDDNSSTSHTTSTVITYRPARLVNLRGKYQLSVFEGGTSSSEEFAVNLHPFPAIQFSMNYRHEDPSESIAKDRLSSLGTWRITKFMRAKLGYTYSQTVTTRKTVSHAVNANLNAVF